MRKHITKLAIIGAAITPAFVHAQAAINNLTTIVTGIGTIVRDLLPIVFGLAILAFFWGVFRYIFSGGSDEKASARHIMLWALIAIFIMASLWGIVLLAQQTLGISNTTTGTPPSVTGL